MSIAEESLSLVLFFFQFLFQIDAFVSYRIGVDEYFLGNERSHTDDIESLDRIDDETTAHNNTD